MIKKDPAQIIATGIVVNNFLTDLLERTIEENYDGFFLNEGDKVKFRKRINQLLVPHRDIEFNLPENVTVEEMSDALEALGIPAFPENSYGEYIHSSDRFPDIRFNFESNSYEDPDHLFVMFTLPRNTLLVVE